MRAALCGYFFLCVWMCEWGGGHGVYVVGGFHVNITHCVLAPVTDGRGRGHPVGTGYLFLFICVLCARLGGKKSATLLACLCVRL